MRVLHVMPSMAPEWGGPVANLSNLSHALERLGVRCEIATTIGYRVGTEVVSIPGVPVYCFETNLPARFWAAYSTGLRKFLDTEASRYDLLHIHSLWHYGCFAAFRAARRHGIPFVQEPHGELDEWRLDYKRRRKRLYRQVILDRILKSADAICALTQAEKNRVAELGLGTPVFITPNGIDTSQVPGDGAQGLPAGQGLIAKYPVLAGKRIILFMGRLHVMKGLDTLARSFVTAAARFPDAVLLIAGPDEDGSGRRAAAMLAEVGLGERAVFAGLVTGDDKQDAFDCADLFVLPSRSEGLSMAMLEALGAGLPVVLTERCNFPEVAERDAGFVVSGSDDAVTEAMCALLADAGLRASMGRKGRELIRKNYNSHVVAKSLVPVYQKLMDNRADVGPQ